MNKHEHIEYWLKTSEEDYEVFNVLYSNTKLLHALFIGNLVLEKILKAHWVKDNEINIPPKSHNLLYLLKQTKLQLSQEL